MIDYYIGLSAGLKASLIITMVLMLSTSLIGLRVRRLEPTDVPNGITLIAIMFVDGINNMMHDFFKTHWRKFTPYMMTVLLFLLFANTASLWGLSAPLANINVALGFSILAFGSIQVSAIFIKNPIKHFKGLLEIGRAHV